MMPHTHELGFAEVGVVDEGAFVGTPQVLQPPGGGGREGGKKEGREGGVRGLREMMPHTNLALRGPSIVLRRFLSHLQREGEGRREGGRKGGKAEKRLLINKGRREGIQDWLRFLGGGEKR